jgi:uncharacterized membrane protein
MKKDYIFLAVLITITAGLAFLPTGFDSDETNSVRVRSKILKTDDTDVDRFGMIKVGTQVVTARVLSGRFKGTEVTAYNTLIGKLELDKFFVPEDTALVVLELDESGENIRFASVIDHYRINIELILVALFVVVLLGYARWVGAKAVVSFLFTGLMIWKVLLPGFLRGWNPVYLSLGIVTVLTAIILFLIAGLNRKGAVAFFGAFAGIVTTCVLSLVFGKAFDVHGAVRPFSETLLYSGYGHLNLTRIFLSGIFLASSGAVMDIAMDISASMNEIHEKNPNLSTKELIGSGFSVGRAVIGTMTTTLLLAYSGGYTALLMVFMAQGTPVKNIFNITYVSAEILHTLVGSFGLVMVAPFTAIIGGALYHRDRRRVRD